MTCFSYLFSTPSYRTFTKQGLERFIKESQELAMCLQSAHYSGWYEMFPGEIDDCEIYQDPQGDYDCDYIVLDPYPPNGITHILVGAPSIHSDVVENADFFSRTFRNFIVRCCSQQDDQPLAEYRMGIFKASFDWMVHQYDALESNPWEDQAKDEDSTNQ